VRKPKPEDIQRVLYLHSSYSLSPGTIAERLHMKESQVKTILDRLDRRERTTGTAETKKRAIDPLQSARPLFHDESRDSLPVAYKTGYGRRFTKAEIEGIKKAVLEQKRMAEIRTLFRCKLEPIIRIRRAMGVYHDLRRKPKTPDDVRAKVIELLREHSVKAIQGMLKLSHRRICEIATSIGGASVLKGSHSSGRRINGELRESIIESLRAGMSRPEIKARFGVSLSTITAIRQREKGTAHASPSALRRGKTENYSADQGTHTATHNRKRARARYSASPSIPTRIGNADAEQRARAIAGG
jgi:hypothetical protein